MQAEPSPTRRQVVGARAAAQAGLGGAGLSVVLVVAALLPDWAGWSAVATCAAVAGVGAALTWRWTDPVVSAASAFVRATRRRL